MKDLIDVEHQAIRCKKELQQLEDFIRYYGKEEHLEYVDRAMTEMVKLCLKISMDSQQGDLQKNTD